MRIQSMNCSSAAEALPWYLNGSLNAEETASLEAHLETCPKCRQEHRDVAFAAAAYSAHPPAEDLVDFAFHRLALSPRRSTVERHLKFCSACAEELSLIEASRDSLAELDASGADEPPRTPSQSIPVVREMRPRRTANATFWRSTALAASLAAIVGTGLWLWNVGPRSAEMAQGPTTGANEDARAGFGPSLPQLPTANLAGAALVSVEPGTLSSAGEAGSPALVELPSTAQEVNITLRLPEISESDSLELQVLDVSERVVWRGGVLTAAGHELFSTTLPLEFLPQGSSSLRVRRRTKDQSQNLATLPIELLRR